MKEKKSIYVAKLLVVVFGAVILVMAGAAPMVARWYVSLRGMREGTFVTILACWYLCSVPAALALFCLWRLLNRIGKGEPFARENVRDITHVSWCALACTVICAGSAVFYSPFLLVAVAMLFLFAIVQVVAACFRAAVMLAEENSLTI